MTHPGEVLTQAYFEMNGYLVQTNVKYPVKQGWSDLDIIAIHPKTGEKVYASVKSWHTEYFGPRNFDDCYYPFSQKITKDAVEKHLGSKWNQIRKIIVIPELGPQKGQELATALAEKDVEVLETTKILREMVDFFLDEKNKWRDYDNPLLYLLRVLSIYQHLK